MQIRMEHVRAAKLCSRGARQWFVRYNLDYTHFLKHGYPEDVLLATGDALARRVVDAAHTMESKVSHG